MATRVIPNRRDRIATILAAPFMTCSARLPVYALLIAAFVPARAVGFLNLQGLVLFGLYVLGIVGRRRHGAAAAPAPCCAARTPRSSSRCRNSACPNLRTVAMKLLDRVRVFLGRAGTVIFAVAVVVWALAYFPRSPDRRGESSRRARGAGRRNPHRSRRSTARLDEIDNQAAAEHLAQSWLGRAGQVRRARVRAARLGLARLGGGHRGIPGARGRRRRARNDLRRRRRSRRAEPRGPAQGRDLARRAPRVHAADGARAAAVLRVVPAVRGDAGGHSARDEQLALADFRLELHDRARLRRRAC